MSKMKKNKILYSLNAEDFQNVADELIERHLTDEEINKIADWVADNIPWHDLISDGIAEIISEVDFDAPE